MLCSPGPDARSIQQSSDETMYDELTDVSARGSAFSVSINYPVFSHHIAETDGTRNENNYREQGGYYT